MLRIRLIMFALLIATTPSPASDPLSAIPDEADLVIVLEKPTRFVEASRSFPAIVSALELPAVKELFRLPNVKQFFDLIALYESELQTDWKTLLNDVAGNGIAIGSKTDGGAAVIVIDGTKPKVSEAFLNSVLKLVAREAAKDADKPEELRRVKHGDIDSVHFGKEFHAARNGARLYFANNEEALHKTLLNTPKKTRTDARLEARKLLSGSPDAWLWFDLAAAKDTQAGRDFYSATKRDAIQNLVVGGTIDALGRADFLAAGLTIAPKGLDVTIRVPSKRSELRPELAMHVPPAGTPGSLPLLEPAGVLASMSLYLDAKTFYIERDKLMNDNQKADFDQGVKDISKFLPGSSIRKLFEQMGPYHRLVMLDRVAPLYKASPEQPIPGFAYIGTMRDPAYAKTATGVLRAAALIGTPSSGLTMTEQTIESVNVVVYRFSEAKQLQDDLEGLRFQFSPCFAIVGDNLVVGSRPDVLAPVIIALRTEKKSEGDPAVWRAKAYGNGVAGLIGKIPEPLVTNLMLTRNLSLKAAEAETKQIAAWFETLGAVEFRLDHRERDYEMKLQWTLPEAAK